MDKVANYHQIICDVLDEYASIRKSLTPNVKTQVIIDPANHHYQLLSIGWHNNRFVYVVAFHFDIIDGKIWIQQNNTDSLIADELMDRGVDRNDIVLGFLSEKACNQAGFAVL